MGKIKKISRKFKKKVKTYLLSIYSFFKRCLKVLIAVILMSIYLFSTYLLWCKYSYLFVGIKEVITMQIQGTALFIGIIAGTIALYNFWRKSGVNLTVAVGGTEYNYGVSIKNHKDKEVTIIDLFIFIKIDGKEYAIDILSSKDMNDKSVSIKAYGYEFIELPLPVAIQIISVDEDDYITMNPLYNEYVYIKPLVAKGFKDTPKIHNIIMTTLRGHKSLKVGINTSEKYIISKTKRLRGVPEFSRLVFCNKEDIKKDYLLSQQLLAINRGEDAPSFDLDDINNSELDDFIKRGETSNEAMKKQKLFFCPD